MARITKSVKPMPANARRSMSPNHFCGCERGDDCTRTSMCYVQHVEQDLNDVIETLTAENRRLASAAVEKPPYKADLIEALRAFINEFPVEIIQEIGYQQEWNDLNDALATSDATSEVTRKAAASVSTRQTQ